MRPRCTWPEGVTVKPDGKHELDACLYEDIQVVHSVTVIVSRCRVCGHVTLRWERQPDSREENLDGQC